MEKGQYAEPAQYTASSPGGNSKEDGKDKIKRDIRIATLVPANLLFRVTKKPDAPTTVWFERNRFRSIFLFELKRGSPNPASAAKPERSITVRRDSG